MQRENKDHGRNVAHRVFAIKWERWVVCLRKGNGDGRNRGLGEEALASETMETVEVMPQ
jgi:hypothetical protein